MAEALRSVMTEVSPPAAHNDLRAARNFCSRRRRLFPHSTAAADLHLKSSRGGHLNHRSNGQADQSWHAEFFPVADRDVIGALWR